MIRILLIQIVFIVYTASCQSPESKVNSESRPNSIYKSGQQTRDGTGKYYLGREIAQVMGAAGAGWLERSEREKEENTRIAIDKMPLSANSVVADIGAGSGYYSFAIAKKIPEGKVYAVDIQDGMLQLLRQKKDKGQVKNVEIIKGSESSPNLPDNSIDLAIMVDVYHELAYPHEMLQALKKALKSEGQILLLEYRAEDPSIPIKPLHKLSVVQANKEMQANGFEIAEDGEFLPIQHFLLYSKKS